MKTVKLLKKLESSIDKLYDSLYAVRDGFDDIEDEEIDFLVNGFIEQIEMCIVEGDINIESIRDQIAELPEE
jgi:hypothetical protein